MYARVSRLVYTLDRMRYPIRTVEYLQGVDAPGVEREQRGYDGGKKVRGRKRHILVNTEGLMVEAGVHSAKLPDQDGIRHLLKPACSRLPHLS